MTENFPKSVKTATYKAKKLRKPQADKYKENHIYAH